MHFVRLYATADGESHFEDITLRVEGDDVPAGYSAAESALIPALGALFRHVSVSEGADPKPHNAPRRQFVVWLVGEVEIEASDGEVRRFDSRKVLLAEDTSGKGHTTRNVGDRERVSLVIPLGDEAPATL